MQMTKLNATCDHPSFHLARWHWLLGVGRVPAIAALALAFLCPAFPPAVQAANLKPLYAKIIAAVRGGNAAKTQWAVGQMESLLKGDEHVSANVQMYYVWLRLLLARHDYAAVARITRLENVLAPGDMPNVWHYQMYRTRALLLMGRSKAALRNAKSLFNLVPSTQTAQAAMLVYRCLLAQKSNGRQLAKQFMQEETSGARPPPAGKKPATCMVLEGIAVNGKPYMKDIQHQLGVGTRVLIARGNLWLLADHPNKAMQCFKTAYDIATPNQLAMVCDRMAAAMRAKYGTIGVANAWLKSIAK